MEHILFWSCIEAGQKSYFAFEVVTHFFVEFTNFLQINLVVLSSNASLLYFTLSNTRLFYSSRG